MGEQGVTIRRAGLEDVPAVVALAGEALGWRPEDPNEALFRWKHLANPFGASPMWLASVDGRVAGFRAFLRWEFDSPDRGVQRAVRAVDTATLPEFQGQGLFRLLTMNAVEVMLADEVDFVFNTPNEKSRPGYLKMGWVVVGPVPVAVRPTSIGALTRMAQARVPAGKWSVATRAGGSAAEVLADEAAVSDLLAAQPPPRGLRTRRSPDFLRWRYAQGPAAYRAIALDDDVRRGLILFRLRDRGGAVEATIGDVLVPGDRPAVRRRLLNEVVNQAAPDYLIAISGSVGEAVSRRLVPMSRQGPTLTWRALRRSDAPSRRGWALTLGDIELF